MPTHAKPPPGKRFQKIQSTFSLNSNTSSSETAFQQRQSISKDDVHPFSKGARRLNFSTDNDDEEEQHPREKKPLMACRQKS